MLETWPVASLDPAFAERVQAAIDAKTKPPGSLGQIETLARRLACVQKSLTPDAEQARLLLFAADHGMAAEGVSAWPQDVTAQMVLNFLAGGAAANAFARANRCKITVVDAGVAGPLPEIPQLIRAGIRQGTRNAAIEDALTPDEVQKALDFGASLAAEVVEQGAKIIALGEMGIGNTSSAALLAASVAGLDLERLVGPGAGLTDDGIVRKKQILLRIAARRGGALAPFDALCAFGGLEIACMAGAMIGASSKGAVVLIDGFIASAAALCVLTARPDVAPYAVFAHLSKEPGHRLILDALGATPLLDLGLRLGEGTGALLALPLLRAACSMINDMATFESAGVSGKE